MKLKFEKGQSHQLEAIDSIVSIFRGQEKPEADQVSNLDIPARDAFSFVESIHHNSLQITDETLLLNLQDVQRLNGLPKASISKTLERLWFNETSKSNKFTERNSVITEFPNFSVEMETGTGKTYVYLRAIYELNKAYGWSKFLIVVPSIAIREGVLKSLEMTSDHFKELYGNTPCEFKIYDSTRPSNLVNFARSSAIQILVINIDSFAKDENVINQISEFGTKPISYIRSTRPVVIIDEPQNMETEIRKRAISNLDPLFTLRFSATHKNTYNLIYRLDPVRAYDLGLVKQIEVDSVVNRSGLNGGFVSLDEFKTTTRSLAAKMTIYVNREGRRIKKQVTAKAGDNLFDLSKGVEGYESGFIINEIDAESGNLTFSSGYSLNRGESVGGLSDQILREMIDATVENHFRKEKALAPRGIKVLSLFFVDKVANYRLYDSASGQLPGIFANWFEESFQKWSSSPLYKGLIPLDANSVHDGYFSQDKGRLRDSKEGRLSKADNEAFTLIMKDKERLLDPRTPLRFIFSHSALREGWDNPNVFQICTLNESKSALKKRQELGRGLRLCVDASGVRVTDRELNRLTVIANEEYEDFSRALQKEIQEDCGVNFEGRIKNARSRVHVKLKSKWMEDQLFLELWERIKHRTVYSVDFSTESLISACISALDAIPKIETPSIHRERNRAIFVRDEQGELLELAGIRVSSREREVKEVQQSIPDLVSYIESKTEISRHTITQILLGTSRLGDVFINPQKFMEAVVSAIEYVFESLKISGIKYEKLGSSSYEMRLFEQGEIEQYLDNLVKVHETKKTLYNYTTVDSDSRPEREFAEACEVSENILFYVKLPRSFRIPTPIGAYVPDWALIKTDEDTGTKIYFVAETKDKRHAQDWHLLRERERQKIECATKHFEAIGQVAYRVVDSAYELRLSEGSS